MAVTTLKAMLVMAFIISSLAAFAEEGGNFERPPAHVSKAVRSGQPYYAGMTKEQLYKVYPVSRQESYYAQGNEEWILFMDEAANDSTKNAIAFYLKNGVVSGWKKQEIPLTPDERRKIVLDRSKTAGAHTISGGAAAGDKKARRPIYDPSADVDRNQ